jgi:hypothetical protein
VKTAQDGAHADPFSGWTRTIRGESAPAQNRKASLAAFWRLLADYERISSDETTAIRGEDFETAATIQALKAVLFAALEDGGRDLGIDRRHASFEARLEKIAAGERANEAFVKKLLARNAAERRTLETARSRLRGLLHAYVAVKVPGIGSFFARG